MRLLVGIVLAVLAVLTPATSATAATPTATTFTGTPTVAPLFRGGPTLDHECTASVIGSRHRNLVLTAAHCLFGVVRGWQIAPGYHDGRTPYGVWTVAAA